MNRYLLSSNFFMKSWYCSYYNACVIGPILQRGPGPGPEPSEKADPGPLKRWTLRQNSLYELKIYFLNSRI